MAGNYKTPLIYVNVKAVFTNTVLSMPSRWAAKATFRWNVSRQGSARAGCRPDRLRRQNFVTEFPYATPVAVEYDTGDYVATMDGSRSRTSGFAARRAEGEKSGKLRGLV